MTKVLLVNPPQTRYEGSVAFDIHLPLGLMYIAATVKNICSVEILDCLIYDVETKKGNAVVYGATNEQIRRIIEEKKPDVVGISVHSGSQFSDGERVAKIAKKVNSKIITVFGGSDPSARFETILKSEYCDYCVVGDGEETFYEFINNLSGHSSLEKIAGLAYNRNGIVHFQPRQFGANLDFLPFPSYDLINLKKYLKNKRYYRDRSTISKNSSTIITSRGCPNRCIFCSIKLHMGQKWRAHSPEYIVNLLRVCKEKYGLSNFHFEDDNLALDKQRFEKILDLIIAENLKIKWDTPNGVRIDSLNYTILEKMKKSGCIHLVLAIESGNQRVLDEVIHKGINLVYATKIIKFCKELKIPAHAFYVIGFPGETVDEMRNTIDLSLSLYRKYDLRPYLMVATPLYGTDLYDICIRNKLIEKELTSQEIGTSIQSWGEPPISTTDFSKEDIKCLLREYHTRFKGEFRRYLLRHPKELVIEAWRTAVVLARKR